MYTTRRVLSTLAGTGLALMFGVGMAVAASGVFTAPDPVSIGSPAGPAQHSESPGAQFFHTDALTPGHSSSRSSGDAPPPADLPRGQSDVREVAPPPRPVIAAPPAPDARPPADCRLVRSGLDGRTCVCDPQVGDTRESGHQQSEVRVDDAELTGHGRDR